MKPRIVALSLLVALTALAPSGPASAQLSTGTSSPNVQLVANLPEMQTAISIGFIRDTMFVSTTLGLYSYDVSDPASPELVGALPMYLWENEDMTIDVERELAFISRDSRGFTSHYVPAAVVPLGILHVIDVSDPSSMQQIGMATMPIGHTAECVEGCRYIWTAGLSRGVPSAPATGGRAVWATDLTDPTNPVVCGPIDQGGSGTADIKSSHDVAVDPAGIAWISGGGGAWGYWTHGRHRDPRTGKVATATGCAPIPYGGGASPERATPSRFIHNAWRNPALRAGTGAPRGSVLLATEENLTSSCATSGRFAAYDLRGTLTGRAWKPGGEDVPMKVLDTWTPEGQPGSTGCASAHWFEDRGDGMLAYAFYGQGIRFLDASNPRNLRQVGYWVGDLADAWAAYWHRGYVYVADYSRGIDVLRFTGRPGGPAARVPAAAPGATSVPVIEADPAFGFVCRLRPGAGPASA